MIHECEPNSYVSCSTLEIRVRLVPSNMFKPSSNFLTDHSKAVLRLLVLLLIVVCVCHTVLSVPCSLVVSCSERAGLLALVCVMYLEILSLSHIVSWVRRVT